MPVLVTATVPGQTAEGDDATPRALGPLLRAAPGILLHAAHAGAGGWHVIEVRESATEATDCFASHERPNLPPGIKPRRALHELHSMVRP